MARLLHVFPSFSLGGSQARLVALINADLLSDEHVIVSLNGEFSALDLIAAGACVRCVDGRALMRGRLRWKSIRRWIRQEKPDRLLTYNWGASDWAIAALGTGIAHVAVEDGFGPEEAVRRFARRSLTRRLVFGRGGSVMVVPSHTLESIALDEWQIPPDRLVYIPNGVDPARFKALPSRFNASPSQSGASQSTPSSGVKRSEGDDWVIGTLAGLRPEKRLDRLIDALALVRAHRPVRLKIGGAGALEQTLREQCIRAGVQEAVEFVGFVKDAPSFLQTIDVFVLSSDTEQLPISMIEAMLSGLPVIATDVGDIRQSLPRVQAEGVVPATVEDLASGLHSLLEHPERMTSWGVANRAFAIERFSFQSMVHAWRRIFDGEGAGKVEATQTLDARLAGNSKTASASTRVLVYSSLFPSAAAPQAGIFIKERMFRVAQHVPLVVVAPQPWSPFDWLIRVVKPNFRPVGAAQEFMEGIPVYRPRFFSLPALLKGLDGRLMAKGSARQVKRLVRDFKPTVLDAHFVYPDGYAASLLARRHGLPLTITLRGSKDEWLIGTAREPAMREALTQAQRIFAVSDALKRDVGLKLGQPERKIQVVRNGVDLERFYPADKTEARKRFGLDERNRVIVSAGWLIERKGFHRLIPVFAEVHRSCPEARLLIVGSGTTQEDRAPSLRVLARQCGVEAQVVFAGAIPPDEMRWCYSAGDVFALATSHEGWANVFLEAMACGLPVVTTDVGGNAQVVSRSEVGLVVPYWNAVAFGRSLNEFLHRAWDRRAIRDYAMQNGWASPVNELLVAFNDMRPD
jgi:teichuronic acid biosynthesis glycosyltransferase TuaC